MPDNWWRDKLLLQQEVERFGSFKAAARNHGTSDSVLRDWWGRHSLDEREPVRRNQYGDARYERRFRPTTATDDSTKPEDEWLLAALKRLGDNASIDEIADYADVSPRRVRDAAERLGVAGFRVSERAGHVVLERVAPQRDYLHTVNPDLFDGDVLRFGVVSDTHLGANEEALEQLHCAYDVFAQEGIREVLHAGDWGTGVGMFRTHHAEAHVHTSGQQVKKLIDHYPKRDGIVTRGISGNHDLEGDFGRIGFDPVAALAAERKDIDYLGPYSAWLELREGTGSWLHLLHGSGGMSYAVSYKAQKLVDGYPSARKPAALIVGHWHVRGDFTARGVNVVFPGCFEWQSRFMQRLGLQPAVGFHIIELTVADDGSVVRWRTEWLPFFPGRSVAVAA